MAQALFLVERDVKLYYPLGAVFSVGERLERWKYESMERKCPKKLVHATGCG